MYDANQIISFNLVFSFFRPVVQFCLDDLCVIVHFIIDHVNEIIQKISLIMGRRPAADTRD